MISSPFLFINKKFNENLFTFFFLASISLPDADPLLDLDLDLDLDPDLDLDLDLERLPDLDLDLLPDLHITKIFL